MTAISGWEAARRGEGLSRSCWHRKDGEGFGAHCGIAVLGAAIYASCPAPRLPPDPHPSDCQWGFVLTECVGLEVDLDDTHRRKCIGPTRNHRFGCQPAKDTWIDNSVTAAGVGSLPYWQPDTTRRSP
jgi:hypothetical protein